MDTSKVIFGPFGEVQTIYGLNYYSFSFRGSISESLFPHIDNEEVLVVTWNDIDIVFSLVEKAADGLVYLTRVETRIRPDNSNFLKYNCARMRASVLKECVFSIPSFLNSCPLICFDSESVIVVIDAEAWTGEIFRSNTEDHQVLLGADFSVIGFYFSGVTFDTV
ncbi:hypothetical protein GGQ73_004678 [Rhizobium skierniewicense]|uniref:Uncharacterized protein n=1 Tax=Rhizobium skierniewicense TaxID=984260 RepID=A0A7W6CAJ8_9HYPH|nr:hypothetical protein [Rhizobium skierniewicense]